MGAVATGLAIAGPILGGIGDFQNSRFQASVAENNAKLALQKAGDARERSKVDARNQSIQTQQLIGRQRASTAAGGVEVDTGSALDLTLDAAQFGELDRLTILNRGEREALGLEFDSANLRAQADQTRVQGNFALAGGIAGAGAAAIDAGAFDTVPNTVLSQPGSVNPRWRVFGSSTLPSGQPTS